MTLPATDSWDVRGVKGHDYKVGPHCSNPNCRKIAEHAHHIVRRSQLGGDFRWIVLHGQARGNLTGVCVGCHNDLTGMVGGHKAAIRFSLADSLFYWCDVETVNDQIEYLKRGPIDPQPPTPETLAERATGISTESDPCPMCGQAARRRPSSQPSSPGGRRRKTWTVKLPADVIDEDGAAVLDTLVLELGSLLGTGQDEGARYYTIVPAMSYCLQDSQGFVDAIKGKG